jgi:hypothetical protein
MRWLSFLPLQVAPGLACSVASLSPSPRHELPGLRCGRALADYLLGYGKPSTQFAGHALVPHNPPPSSPQCDKSFEAPINQQHFFHLLLKCSRAQGVGRAVSTSRSDPIVFGILEERLEPTTSSLGGRRLIH